ncbi:hypothetical protein, partial [Kitasatospora sp. NPDC088134]|uniref:hypothetical protein n=1 Tax=Kitasatospora sp. NPDC088134 TaxID=3364071 RepID=UPI00380A0929
VAVVFPNVEAAFQLVRHSAGGSAAEVACDVVSSGRFRMPSVVGLLEARESAARVRVEELRVEADRILAELSQAEALLERRTIALMELTEALAADAQPEEPVGPVPVPVVAKEPVAGSVVPGWREGMTVQALAPEYRRLLAVLETGAGPEGLRAKELAGLLGLELVSAKVEGVRVKAKRLAARGWLAEERPGVFTPRGTTG